MGTYRHPGVYIEEVPSTRAIQGVSTSIPAFIGVTESGLTNTPTLITSWDAYTRTFGGLIWCGFVSWAVYEFFKEGGSSCYIINISGGSGKSAEAKLSSITIAAASPGIWGNSLALTVKNSSSVAAEGDKTEKPVFTLSVVAIIKDNTDKSSQDLGMHLLQQYVQTNNISATEGYYVLESFDGCTEASVDDGAFAERINSNSIFIRVQTGAKGRPKNTASPTPLTGGTAPSYNFSDALKSIDKINDISLLSIPDTVNIGTGANQATQINQVLRECDKMMRIFYVADPPFGLDVAGVLSFKSGSTNSPALNSSYGALYYPWLWIYNAISSSNVPVPPSGAVLGRYAYTDGTVGVFKSPAGVNDGALRTVTRLETQVTDADQNSLNPEGINCIRNFINYGNVIWGARTVSADTQWTYLSVRRLFIYVEQSLKQSLQWVVFEPNSQRLWTSVTRDVSAFLTTLWQQGGLFGSTAAEAFFVTCNEANNPPETRRLGQLFIDVGLAPVFPAEFVVIRITQKTAGPDSGS